MGNALEWTARAPGSFWRDRKQARKESKIAGRLLAAAYIAIYAGSDILWEEPMNLLTSLFPPVLGALARCVIPAAFGSALCALSWKIFRSRRGIMTAAYSFLNRAAVIIFIVAELLLWGERRGQTLIFLFFARFIIPPLLIGGYISAKLYYNWWNRNRRK